MTSRHMQVGSILAALALSQAAVSAAAQQVEEGGFVVFDKVRQGMTERQFTEYVRARGLQVTQPLPEGATKQIKFNETTYWFTFCGGRLTSASWLIDENKDFIKSVNQRINEQGFEVGAVYVQSDYSDIAKKEINILTMKLVRPQTPYSVTYSLFDTNGQVMLEDTRYDDTYGCAGDPQE